MGDTVSMPHGAFGPRPPAAVAMWGWVVLAVILFGLGAMLVWWWRRWQQRRNSVQSESGPISPSLLLAEARTAFVAVMPAEPFDEAAQRQMAFELSETFKRYWERRCGLFVVDKTTEELGSMVSYLGNPAEEREALRILARLDAVKFAAGAWTQREAKEAKEALMAVVRSWDVAEKPS